MASEIPQRQSPESREVPSLFITPGTARFMAAASLDLSIKRIYNPEPVTFQKPEDKQAVTTALEQADQQYVDMGLVDGLSDGLRGAVSQQKEQNGKSKEQQKKEWAENMVTFLQNLAAKATPELKELAKDKLCVDLDQTDPAVLWREVGNVWDRYLAKGSDIRRFFEDLIVGIPNGSPESVAEMQRKIGLAYPLMGIFGDERINILVRDASNAAALLGIDKVWKPDLIGPALVSLHENFSTPTEKAAYELLWESIKNQIPSEAPEKAKPKREPTTPPAAPPLAEEEAIAKPEARPSAPQPPMQPVSSREPVAPPRAVQQEQPVPLPVERRIEPRPAPAAIEHVPSRREELPLLRREEPQREKLTLQEEEKPLEHIAAVLARNPERPWLDDALLAREFNRGGFVLGAFDGLDKGGMYSSAVARKLKKVFAKRFESYADIPSVDMALRQAINIFDEAQSFINRVQMGAEKELSALKVSDREKREIVDNIGTTGLVAITAKGEDGPVLATINLGHSRLIAFDPEQGIVKPLTVDQTIAARKFRIRQLTSEDEAFLDEHRARLSRWARQANVDELEQKFQEQLTHGWSQTDEVLRVFPLKKGNIYLSLTNGVTLNIPPGELPKVIKRAYNNALSEEGNVDVRKMVRYVAREARRRMLSPEQYRLTVRGKSERYVIPDDAGAAGVVYS